MSEDELRGTARVLRQTIPDLVRFDQTSVPFLRESRALSACTNNVLVPFMGLKIPNPETGNEAENSDQPVRAQLQRGMPGLSGESRLSDGNNQYFHAGRDPARQPGPARPAAGRRQHADAAPARRPLRDAGAAEPARARRPDRGLPGPRLDSGSDREAAGAGAEPDRHGQRGAGLRGQRPAAGGQGEGRVPASRAQARGRRAADDHRDQEEPRRLPRGRGRGRARPRDRRVHPVQPAPALPARGEAVLHGEGRAARRPGGHAGPGPDRRHRRRARSATSARSTSRTARPS